MHLEEHHSKELGEPPMIMDNQCNSWEEGARGILLTSQFPPEMILTRLRMCTCYNAYSVYNCTKLVHLQIFFQCFSCFLSKRGHDVADVPGMLLLYRSHLLNKLHS